MKSLVNGKKKAGNSARILSDIRRTGKLQLMVTVNTKEDLSSRKSGLSFEFLDQSIPKARFKPRCIDNSKTQSLLEEINQA